MKNTIVVLSLALAIFQYDCFAQGKKQFQFDSTWVSVALPENTLPMPYWIAHSDSFPVEIIRNKPKVNFPGTVYFNPSEIIGQANDKPFDFPTISALRFYLDTSAWSLPVSDLSNISGLPLRVNDKKISRFFAPFYFKKYEVTNREYKEFTTWVRDSLARSILAQIYPDRYYNNPLKTLNWKTPIAWNGKDENATEALKQLYFSENEVLFHQKILDTNKLIYTYSDENNCIKNITVYPDTLIGFKDFSYSFNEVLFRLYYSHEHFKNYPVVGVSYEQAKAFCNWKSKQLQKKVPRDYCVEVDLPFDYEREYVISKYASGQLSDVGCMADLMAVTKPEFFPGQLNEIMKCSNRHSVKNDISITATHPSDLSRIRSHKRNLITSGISTNEISGIYGNVSEWMNESYQANWMPFITKRKQLLESIQSYNQGVSMIDSLSDVKTTDSTFYKHLTYLYKEEMPLILQLEELFNRYCDADGRLVRGGNWLDSRCLCISHSEDNAEVTLQKDAMTFVSPTKSSSMIGFRYVIRVTPMK